jgi:hypothetical protein
MALVTFSNATDIEAADLNNNFQDEDNAAAAAFGKSPQQNFRVEVIDLDSATPLAERSCIIRPSTYLRVFDQQLYLDNTSNTPGAVTATLECLTDSRLLGGSSPSEETASGQSTPYSATSSLLAANNKILIPGMEYRLSLASDSATACDFAAFELVTYGIRGTS